MWVIRFVACTPAGREGSSWRRLEFLKSIAQWHSENSASESVSSVASVCLIRTVTAGGSLARVDGSDAERMLMGAGAVGTCLVLVCRRIAAND